MKKGLKAYLEIGFVRESFAEGFFDFLDEWNAQLR